MGEHAGATRPKGIGGVSYRAVAAVVVVGLLIAFIVLNRDETEVSFVFFSMEAALWIALAVAAAAGFVAGALVSRRRYRR